MLSDDAVRVAMVFLRRAIALHEKHMNGTAPTTGPAGERSQAEMMTMMRRALAALTGDTADVDRMRGMQM